MRPDRVCPKCREFKRMTVHHLLPRRFFGKKGNHLTVFLCAECHSDLEVHIPQHEQLAREKYFLILIRFLEGV